MENLVFVLGCGQLTGHFLYTMPFLQFIKLCNKLTVFISVSDLDPFHFGQPDPGSKNQQKSWEIFTKTTKIIQISYFFFKTIKIMFTDLYIYPINNKTDHISEKYIFFIEKKVIMQQMLRFYPPLLRL